jgi:protein tyrosine phosphatase
MGSPINNFCEAAPHDLWRGAKPEADGAGWLIEHGVRSIVNLELLHDDQQVLEQAELKTGGKYTVDYFRVADWELNAKKVLWPVLDDHVAHFLAITETQTKPIYVHCRSGQNRTGVMVAAYRVIEENKDVDKTIVELKSFNGFWSEDGAEYIRNLSQATQREKMRQKIDDWKMKLKRDSLIVCENKKCVAQNK